MFITANWATYRHGLVGRSTSWAVGHRSCSMRVGLEAKTPCVADEFPHPCLNRRPRYRWKLLSHLRRYMKLAYGRASQGMVTSLTSTIQSCRQFWGISSHTWTNVTQRLLKAKHFYKLRAREIWLKNHLETPEKILVRPSNLWVVSGFIAELT